MKLSIITINYNSADGLSKTIESVLEQEWNDFEFIIIDGGSTDESVEIIRQHQDKLAYWVSERDRGVYNAMNKGISKATGEYLLMLNSGDLLCDSLVLKKVFGSSNHQEDILAGDVYRTAEGKVLATSSFPDRLTFKFLRTGTLSHQATFIKKRVHDIVGLYDENLKFSSDWKLFILAVCKYNLTYRHLPFFVSICDCGGLTCDPANFPAMKLESENILKDNFAPFLDDYAEFDALKAKSVTVRFSKIWPQAKSYIKGLLQSA